MGAVAFEQEVKSVSEIFPVRLGKGAAISHPCMLHFSDYQKKSAVIIPETYNYWKGKKPIPIQDWGNNDLGDCTIASQGELQQYMERLETKRVPVIPKQNIIDTYYNMVERVYGKREDSGAFEMDALNNWRNPDYTFKDAKGNSLTIDAYTKINHTNLEEVKKALFLSGAHGIKVCFQLPLAWSGVTNNVWDIPVGQKPTGQYKVGSWGGHSTSSLAIWNKDWLTILSSWQTPPFKISWRAFAIYCDEAYSVVDSVDSWRKRGLGDQINLKKLVSDVNSISDIKIAV